MKTDVMFRVTRSKADGFDLYALFPGDAGTHEPHTCSCYQHVGQHSSADLAGCINASRPATRAEYRGLARELRQRGYKLRIVQRQTSRHRREREGQINAVGLAKAAR
jgi:hypothetical protein